jgi:hypothetical protein
MRSYGLLRIFMHREENGEQHGLSTLTELSFFIFLPIYQMCENEINYINMRGNLKHCHEIHKRRMQELDLPWVTYSTFRHRIVDYKWTVYRAIHTPAYVAKRDRDRRRKAWWSRLYWKTNMYFRKIF